MRRERAGKCKITLANRRKVYKLRARAQGGKKRRLLGEKCPGYFLARGWLNDGLGCAE